MLAVAAGLTLPPRRCLRLGQPMTRHAIRRARARVIGPLLERRPPCRVAVLAMRTGWRTRKLRVLPHHAGRHNVGRAGLLLMRG